MREQCHLLAIMSSRLLFAVIMGITLMGLTDASDTKVTTITHKDSYVFVLSKKFTLFF